MIGLDIDLPNLPKDLVNHLMTIHANSRILVRSSASTKGFHVLIYTPETRCPVCEMYCDSNFVEYRKIGKPLILYSSKMYPFEPNYLGKEFYRKCAGTWTRLSLWSSWS